VLHAHFIQSEPAEVEACAPQASGHCAGCIAQKRDAPINHPSDQDLSPGAPAGFQLNFHLFLMSHTHVGAVSLSKTARIGENTLR
jgi:hypothetical protein